mmetsp:Transcript_13080/g.30674  ORF Transcript_13080/g.30674 Transcript_13080/m.30674 type:complete len:204 (-) Transcript_13080:140-751(-)
MAGHARVLLPRRQCKESRQRAAEAKEICELRAPLCRRLLELLHCNKEQPRVLHLVLACQDAQSPRRKMRQQLRAQGKTSPANCTQRTCGNVRCTLRKRTVLSQEWLTRGLLPKAHRERHSSQLSHSSSMRRAVTLVSGELCLCESEPTLPLSLWQPSASSQPLFHASGGEPHAGSSCLSTGVTRHFFFSPLQDVLNGCLPLFR